MANVLTREQGIANNTTPTGRTLGVVIDEHNPTLLAVKYTDGGSGTLPEYLTARWTRRVLAEDAIKKYVTEFWDTSDKAVAARR